MRDEAISKKVLWDNIKGWTEKCKYYEGKTPEEIPLSELKALIEECPPIGKDSSFIENARLNNERKKGQTEVVRAVLNSLRPYEESDKEK